jgi:hypothetical protein
MDEDGAYFDPEYLEIDRIICREELDSDEEVSSDSDNDAAEANATESGSEKAEGSKEAKEGKTKSKPSPRYRYLVKWKRQAYDECTWEMTKDLKGHERHIKAYEERLEREALLTKSGFEQARRASTRALRQKKDYKELKQSKDYGIPHPFLDVFLPFFLLLMSPAESLSVCCRALASPSFYIFCFDN